MMRPYHHPSETATLMEQFRRLLRPRRETVRLWYAGGFCAKCGKLYDMAAVASLGHALLDLEFFANKREACGTCETPLKLVLVESP